MNPGAGVLVGLLAALTVARGDGWEYLAEGKPAYARTAFRNQLRKNPEDARLQAGLGLAELALGNSDAAIDLLLEALRRDPAEGDARHGLARAFLLRARSRIALGRGDEDETRYLLLDAQNQAERCAELRPEDPDPCVLAAHARLELGDEEGARRWATEAERRGLEPARARRLQGEIAASLVSRSADEGSSEAWEAGRKALEALIAEDPRSPELRFQLGDLHHAYGRWDEALAAWKLAVDLDPFDRPALELVLAYLKVPELRAPARAVLETARARAEKLAPAGDPRPAFAIFCVGQACLTDLELEEAARLFQRAREMEPSIEVQCSLGLADAAFRGQRHDDAAAAWRAAFAADAPFARALLVHLGADREVAASVQFLARREVERRRGDAARELLAIAFALTPDDEGACNDYAFLCRETGRHEESWRAYSHLIELAPEQPRYLNDAALVLHDYLKKDLSLARSLYERALAAAAALLADPLTPQAAREMAEAARTDAANNLRRLDGRS